MPTKKIAVDKPQLWVALYDAHWPKTDLATLGAARNFIANNEVAGIILGGDQLDLECISHHTKNKPLYRTQSAYMRDVTSFDEKFLTPIEADLTKGAEKIWHEGNHERFSYDLIEEQPELDGLVDHVRLLKLKERGWRIIPLGHAFKLGKLSTVHGEVLSGTGNQGSAFPARKAVEMYGGNVLAGHTHAPQSFTKISPVEHVQKWMAWIAPILGRTNPGYLRNRPTAWLNGLVLIEVWEGGRFNLYPVITQDGKFSYAGRLYRG